MNFVLLISVAVGVVTVTKPEVAPSGIVTDNVLFDFVTIVAGTPLNETAPVLARP